MTMSSWAEVSRNEVEEEEEARHKNHRQEQKVYYRSSYYRQTISVLPAISSRGWSQ
jgi:hypothetical protein